MSDQHRFSVLPSGFVAVFAVFAFGAFALVGCDSAGPSAGQGSDVEVGFGTTSSSTTTTYAKAGDSLVVSGTNGTLKIDDIRFIVSEVELEGDADSAEFETEKPAFVDLPLNSNDVVSVVSDRTPAGTYTQFQFEVEDADLDDDGEEQMLRNDIESAGFSNFPAGASMVAVGTFTPSNGDPQPFTSFFDAEIEVEIEMEDRPFEVGTDDPARQLTVNLSPSRWFVSDGNPLDLSADKYQSPSEPVEFEIEFESESEVEFDD